MDGTYSIGSGGSKHSTPRYRSVNSSSTVDESLFGGSDSRVLKNSGRRIVHAPIPPTAVVISQYDLDRLRSESIIKTEADLAADRERAQALKEEKEAKARERKERMRQLEKKASQLAQKSDIEIANDARKQALRAMASEQMDQNSDVVKLLNSMAMRASAYSIRDKQLEEKHRLEEQEKQFDRRMDVMIEIDRVRDIQRREEEEMYKRNKRIDDRRVITEQMQQRERQRMLQLEAREQENQQMRNLMNKYKEEDDKMAIQRAKDIERTRIEVIEANEDAIRRKQQIKEQEHKEMEDMLLYQAMKDAELAKREEEEEKMNKVKKERQAKLLAQQEKAQSNADKIDELRARRAAEEKERRDRIKEKETALRRAKEMKELLNSRAEQANDKKRLKEEEKQQELDQLVQQMQYTMKLNQREDEEKRMKMMKVNEFKTQLHKQIEEIESERARLRSNPDNGVNIRQELIKEEERLKVIRAKMVQDLEAQGVNPKYLSEMKNVDIGKILRR